MRRAAATLLLLAVLTACASPPCVLAAGGTGTAGTDVPLADGVTMTFSDGDPAESSCGSSFCAGDMWYVYVRDDLNTPTAEALWRRMQDGKISCSTCHYQHQQVAAPFDRSSPAYGGSGTGYVCVGGSNNGSPCALQTDCPDGACKGRHFQRLDNDLNQLCLDCHSVRDLQAPLPTDANVSHPVREPIPTPPAGGTPPFKAPTQVPLDPGPDKTPGTSDDQVNCLSCHLVHDISNPGHNPTLVRVTDIVTLCTDCHNLPSDSTHLDGATGVVWPGGQYGTCQGGTNAGEVCELDSDCPDPIADACKVTDFPAKDVSERGACTNCHQPHGWPDAGTPSQDYDRLLVGDRDSICFTCHDGDPGEAADVYTAFNGATNYQDTDQDGALINQRHDVFAADQGYSGSAVVCANCHNPHFVTASGKVMDPDTPSSAFTNTYSKANSYARDGFNFTYDSGTDLDPMSPNACKTSTQGDWAIEWAGSKSCSLTTTTECVVDDDCPSTETCLTTTGDDTLVSGGTYADGGDAADITYAIEVTTGGVFGAAQITVTSTGNRDNSGPTTVDANGFALVGTRGVQVTFIDGDTKVADHELILGDVWTITVSQCATASEPDMVEFCLTCHDKTNLPTGVTMSTTDPLRNIATDFETTDQHGRVVGNDGGNGFMKAPWNDNDAGAEDPAGYAALQCTTCHDGHGSDNLYHLRSSITVRGVQMRVGGGEGSGLEPSDGFTSWGSTTYTFPCFSGATQVDCSTPGSAPDAANRKFGAWCTFCHDMQTHGQPEDNTCRTGHRHGGGAF